MSDTESLPGSSSSTARTSASTELGSLVDASGTNVGGTLKALAADGVLKPSTPTGRGRGFYYRWTATSADTAL